MGLLNTLLRAVTWWNGQTIGTQVFTARHGVKVGEDAEGNVMGQHRSTGVGRPRFWDRARYFGEEKRLAAALDAAANLNP